MASYNQITRRVFIAPEAQKNHVKTFLNVFIWTNVDPFTSIFAFEAAHMNVSYIHIYVLGFFLSRAEASWWTQHPCPSIEKSRDSSFKGGVVVFKPCKMSQSRDIVHQAWKIEMTL